MLLARVCDQREYFASPPFRRCGDTSERRVNGEKNHLQRGERAIPSSRASRLRALLVLALTPFHKVRSSAAVCVCVCARYLGVSNIYTATSIGRIFFHSNERRAKRSRLRYLVARFKDHDRRACKS